MAQRLKRLPTMRETWVRSLGWEDPLEKEMATHSSVLAWRIPWREEPSRLQSTGSQRVGHDWVTSLSPSLSFLYSSDWWTSCFNRRQMVGGWWPEFARGVGKLSDLGNLYEEFSRMGRLFIYGCAGSSLLCGLFSSCGEQGLLLVAVHGLLIVVASLVAEHGL